MIRTLATPDDTLGDRFRRLKDAEQRAAGRFIIESERVLQRSTELGISLHSVLVTPSRFRRLSELLAGVESEVFVADAEVINAIVGFPLHREVVALAHRRPLMQMGLLLAEAKRVVVLEDVVDPDNVGAVFRHAAAFAADAVVLSEHAGDPLYRKAVRTSMGWVLGTPWTRNVEGCDLVGTLRRAGFATVALTPGGTTDLRSVWNDGTSPDHLAILLGSESDGLRPDTMAQCDYRVRVPISSHVDSLNVATTAAVAMFELFR